MAKKKETTSLIEALSEFKELKNIDKNTMIQVLEDSFRNVLSKMFGSDDTFSVIINLEKKGGLRDLAYPPRRRRRGGHRPCAPGRPERGTGY